MDQMDLLYRAFLDYRKNTLEDETAKKLRLAAARASADKDKVETRRTKCTIEEDWVMTIEEGLPFVEKAIMEERQFIRQEGGIVPIEKVRHVSKSSVEHLARHGNLITRLPEKGEDLIPDKLYIVENLSNYAVYENRFLYMLLCYLRDFIDLRYNKIIELGNTYKADMSMTKKFQIGKRTIAYDTHFFEEARNDPYSKMDQATGDMIDRIMVLQKNIQILLNTPLMREVSTAPMLKPPITRTNALRMDNALRQALALYDYVASYQKDGFSVEVIKKTFNPFPDMMGDEFSEMIVLSSFLVYEYGNDLKKPLKEAYEAEEKRREAEAAKKLRRRLEDLQQRARRDGKSLEEYLLVLEERNRSLEPLVHQLEAADSKIDELTNRIAELSEENKRLKNTNENLQAQNEYLEQEIIHTTEQHKIEWAALKEFHIRKLSDMMTLHRKEMAELRSAYEHKIAELIRAHEEEIERLTAAYEQQIAALTQKHEEEMAALRQSHEEEIARLCAEHEQSMAEQKAYYEDQIAEAERAHTAEIETLTQNYEEALADQKDKYEQEINGVTESYRVRIEEMAEEAEALKSRHRVEMEAKEYELKSLDDRHQAKIQAIESNHRKAIEAYDARVNEKDDKYRSMKNEFELKLIEKQELLSEAQGECHSLRKRNHDLKAQLHGIRQQHGLVGDEEDYTSEARYEELLQELLALDALLGSEWKKAKKKIRNEYLWKKSTT